MKIHALILLSILLLVGGCSSSDAAGASTSPSPNPKAAKADKKSAAKPRAGNDESGKAKTIEEAEAAFADKRYKQAAEITQRSLDVLRLEDASRADIIKRMDYLATCQVKAQMYEKAYSTYQHLAQAEPGNADYAKAVKDTRKLYWDKVLAPKLSEAEHQRDRRHYSAAISMAEEVKDDAVKASLSPAPADKVLASIRKAQPKRTSLNGAAKSGSKPGAKPVAPPKPVKIEATIDSESQSAYPESRGGGRSSAPRKKR